MTKDEALKMALEALKRATNYDPVIARTITAIKEALAQTEQEPVAKVVSTSPERIWLDLGFDPSDEDEISFTDLVDATWSDDNATGYGIEYVRADTTPPPRTWVGLTDEEVDKLVDDEDWYNDPHGFAIIIEAALRSKNT